MKSLSDKGFAREDKSHHFFYYHRQDGRVTAIHTMVSHSARDIDKSIIGKMSKQCHLAKDDFLDLIDCPLSRERYEEMLIQKGVLS